MALKIIFMGTPDFSVPTLRSLCDAGHEIQAVYCQPPRPAGRGKKDRKSPVHLFAEEMGINVLCPKSLRNDMRQAEFAALGADIAVVVAYGLILPNPVLDAPKFGCLNLHGSILPRWRGAAPIQRAIMAGDKESGIGVMRMEEGLDTGPVCLEERLEITADMTAGVLHDELSARGGPLMVRALEQLEKGELECRPQSDDGVTYASKIEKSESHIDFNRPAEEVHNHIRGLSPFPGAWFEVEHEGKRERVKILECRLIKGVGNGDHEPGTIVDDQLTIACRHGSIIPTRLQRAGKKPMQRDDFLRGRPLSKATPLH